MLAGIPLNSRYLFQYPPPPQTVLSAGAGDSCAIILLILSEFALFTEIVSGP